MKICMIGLTYPFRGGIAHYTTRFCEELSKDHSVTLFSFKKLYPSFIFPGTSQMDVRSKKKIGFDAQHTVNSMNPFSWIRTAILINKEDPDLVVFQWWNPMFALVYWVICWFLQDFKKAYVCHNVLPHERTLIDRVLLSIAFSPADRFVVQSKDDLKDIKALKPGCKYQILHHPLNDVFERKEISVSALKKKYGLGKNVILFFGYVRAYKGLRYLIEAMPDILKKMDVTLLIVGEFYESYDEYRELIRRLGLSDNVTVVNEYIPNEDVSMYHAVSDMVVVPYVSATQSGIIQTAYLFDTPVLVTDVGGLPEVVDEGVTGFVVKPRDSQAIADAVIQFYKKNMKATLVAGVKKRKKEYTWSAFVKKFMKEFG